MSQSEFATLFDKIQNSNHGYGVFFVGGHVKKVTFGSDSFYKAYKKHFSECVGVYDSCCLPEWLREDLIHVGALR
ncbi:MAG TPA: hypothetical protein PLK99_04425 [Burkholderiales bacterium]|nr:hypothetical protein [Burkholderiales bacterium]